MVIALGAVGWSRLGADDGADEEIRLDTPGEYVEPGAPTNPPLPTDRLPDVELVGVDGSAVRLPDGDDRPIVVNLWYSRAPRAPGARRVRRRARRGR